MTQEATGVLPGGPRPSRRRFEVQIHSADIRRRVRYLFLSDGHLRLGAVAAVLWLLCVAAAAWLAPGVASGLVGRREYAALVDQRRLQGERLQGSVEQLSALAARSEDLHLRMTKVHLAYGLGDESSGQGGFPLPPRPTPAVPSSIYAPVIRRGNHLEADVNQQLRVLDTFLDEVHSFEAAHADQVASTPSLSPLRGDDFVLTSPFGTRRNPFTRGLDFHAGLDLAAIVGTPVHAPAAGQVVFAGRYPLTRSVAWWRYGNFVAIRHGTRFVTLFGHLDSVAVKAGEKVERGATLGAVGNTGWSTSPHLHYEVRLRGAEGQLAPVDPRIYILDHRWRDEERLLVASRSAPAAGFEPLPPAIGRR